MGDVEDGAVLNPVAADAVASGAGDSEQAAGGARRLLLVASNVPDKATLMRAAQPSVTVVEYDYGEQLDLEKLALASTWPLAGEEKFESVGCACLSLSPT